MVAGDDLDAVRDAGSDLLELGKAGVVLNQENFEFRTQYLFGGLNAIKPEMIEDRDSNNPHIKKVRVVSTLEYYLID